ncbi:DsbA family protein [Vibrio sp. SCSIO 43136]|uniref:DsbA family protein n=1 Tax=Vibrio sp. SCSIO 43136 TaxID=2819101 RepID=UPI0020752D2D|nr:DsbA family protein [Vibrio sp. SCSIO 43136]USD66083.1 thioredoxin domain-containing protein [Vibrio sp. SCSIO 43136]
MKTVLFFLLAAVSMAPLAQANTQQKIDEVSEILTNNPEIVDSVHTSLRAYVAQQGSVEAAVKEHYDYMYNNDQHSSFGAESPKLTIINFTDYSCPWCKKLDPVLHELTERHPDEVKVVNVYVPIREGHHSANSANFALNTWLNDREKYASLHKMLVEKPGVHNSQSIAHIAKTLDLRQHVDTNPHTDEMIEQNFALFRQLGIRGTPAMLIEGKVVSGYLPMTKLEPMIVDLLEGKQ